ncbi:MAG: transposase [bacterium]|nr:transposase [bacterium]
MPVELRTIFYHNQQVMYDKLFKISSDILLEVFSKYLNIEIGITSMLHTWSQRMEYHPHMHMIITAGVVNNLGKWVDIDSKKIPIDKIRKLFRDRLVKSIKTSNKIKMYGSYEYLNNKDNLFKYLDELYNQDFVCYLENTII